MTDKKKYKVLTPKTAFSIKQKTHTESNILSEWSSQNVYDSMRDASDGKDFILHDGPPYANGHIHIGHALNKILKDITNRYQYINGRNINYIPGWDCHGLPIEWKVEEQYRKDKKNKDDDIIAFRQDCREYAQKWVDIQRQEFKDLGIIGDWDNAYTTMTFENEASIVQQLHKFLMADLLVQKNKPIMWSPIEKTSLADAEIEYKDVTANTAYVSMPIISSNLKNKDVSAVIWTTTPWTLPGNEAVAINDEYQYAVVKCWNDDETLYLMSEEATDKFANIIGARITIEEYISGKDLIGATLRHPIYNNRMVKIMSAVFVNDEQGTGLVHIAPAHGIDDFLLGVKHELNTDSIIDDTGCYASNIEKFKGIHVYKANSEIISYLEAQGRLVHIKPIIHSYPHSWRSKKPVIYRTTPQWFINLEKFIDNSLSAIDDVNWIPKNGRNRLYSMIEGRTDWCISRQRAWGVPIMIFVNEVTGELLVDYKVNEKIVKEVKEHGCDIWFEKDVNYFIEDHDIARLYTKVTDVLDVWFDSGSSHAYVLNDKRADVYFEGTDQHRGWFQSSLLISTALGGIAPYRDVVTHGFVMASKHKKMSKSDSSGVTPEKVITHYGTDVLRMWAATADFTTDLTINELVLKQLEEQVRKVRNTMRYCLGNLHDIDIVDIISYNSLPELEKYIINRMIEIKNDIIEYTNQYQYARIVYAMVDFCNEISTLYFDVRKDILYCDTKDSHVRKSTLYVLSLIFDFIALYMSPAMPFGVYEARKFRYGSSAQAQQMHTLSDMAFPITNNSLLVKKKWIYLKELRANVMLLLENLRKNDEIKSSLEAVVDIIISEDEAQQISDIDLRSLFIVSNVNITIVKTADRQIVVNRYDGTKCPRCWTYHDNKEELCLRCADAETEE